MTHKLLLDSMTEDRGDVLFNPHGNFKVANCFRFFDWHKQVTRIQI
ncbi:TPA: hypothetical protein R8G79_001500 [Citrobacter amalonaticus]|nr:hypothetical protein [Citrobacter amalonaticus]HCL5922446.1 hypothetical protein [Citrobacter amalonaticus]HEF0022570.1 hypothetical protein [Citrobacter amalonaticus]